MQNLSNKKKQQLEEYYSKPDCKAALMHMSDYLGTLTPALKKPLHDNKHDAWGALNIAQQTVMFVKNDFNMSACYKEALITHGNQYQLAA